MEENVNNPILAMSKEHQIILDHLVSFEESLSEVEPEAFAKRLITLETGFFPYLLKHFRFEEVYLFVAALEGMPNPETIQLVLTLQRQHGELERFARNLFREARFILHDRDFFDLRKEVQAFIAELRAHSREEVAEFFPRVNRSQRSMELVKQLLAKNPEPA